MKDHLTRLMDSIVEVLLVANTPAYLFKHLRAILADISREVPLDRITDELRRELSTESHDMDRMAYAYALFTLMTFKPYPSVRNELHWIKDSRLRWMPELVRRYERTAVVSKLIVVEGDPPSALSVEPEYQLATGTNTILPPVEIR